jgi:hypothetical protein
MSSRHSSHEVCAPLAGEQSNSRGGPQWRDAASRGGACQHEHTKCPCRGFAPPQCVRFVFVWRVTGIQTPSAKRLQTAFQNGVSMF